MANYITYDSNKYIESKNIKVFPCAYRGYYEASGSKVFDPEARSTTEANFTDTFHKLSSNKDSYVVSWKNNTLKCVIGGYYFEIYNHSAIEDWFDADYNPYYLCIQTEVIELGTDTEADGTRRTNVLKSFAGDNNYLDVPVDGVEKSGYIFTGLVLKTTPGTTDISLAPFKVEFSEFGEISDSNKAEDNVGKYYINGSTYTKILATTTLNNGTKIYTAPTEFELDPTKLPVTNILDTSSGKYSVRMCGEDSTIASGDYSVALGDNTKATNKGAFAAGNNTTANGEGSIAVGNNTKASGDGSFAAGNTTNARGEGAVAVGNTTEASGAGATAVGNTTKASGEGAFAAGNNTVAANKGSIALGTNVSTNADNQVVIGQYNTQDSDQAFIIANGTSTAASNKFTVSKTGNVKALGNLEVKGSIKATGSSANDLELGTTTANSTGSIKVYGTTASETPVFQVKNSGDTTIAGTAIIEGNTTINGATTLNSTLSVVGDNKTALGGGLEVAGSTTLNNTLEVTAGKKTTLKGALEVSGTTTLNSTLTLNGNNATTLGGSLSVDGATTLKNNLTVTDGKTTTLGGSLGVAGSTTIAGATTITDETEYTTGDDFDKTAAALKVKGGIHAAKNLNVGGDTNLNTKLIVKTAPGTTETNVKVDGTLKVTGATELTDTLTVADGKTTTLTGKTSITDITDYTASDNTAALTVAGGAYIAKKLHVAGDTTFYDNLEIGETLVRIKEDTESTAVNNGALVVNGGIGVGKNLNVNGATKTRNLTVVSTDGQPNKIQIGNESTSNKGGELLIYGSGTSTVFEVDNKGETYIAGKLDIDNEVTINKKLTVDNAIEISATGISGLTGLTVGGQVNATVFNATSDARLKCNIEDYKFEKSILELPIKRFEYINDESHTKYIGCIAQDLQEICPELVVEKSDGMLAIHESKLVYALLQEVKELKEKVDQLERR